VTLVVTVNGCEALLMRGVNITFFIRPKGKSAEAELIHQIH